MTNPADRERRCYICPTCYANGRALRIFITPGDKPPKCPQHGKMTRERNKPYHPKPT